MLLEKVSYQNTPFFSKLFLDYIEQHYSTNNYYGHFPSESNFEKQILDKKYPSNNRVILADELLRQNSNLQLSERTKKNISLVKDNNTFSITTGHQLNLFLGPVYVIYKIVTTLNIAKKLTSKYPQYNFIPIFWMASEDHDFEEINFFNIHQKSFCWHRKSSGVVGRLATDGLAEILSLFKKETGSSSRATYLHKLFEKAYLGQNNLSDATRFLVNELFGDYGIVIIDGDSKPLKHLFKSSIKKELTENTCYKSVLKTNDLLKKQAYHIQVNPREINLFYLHKNERLRIIKKENGYQTLGSHLEFKENHFLKILDEQPEKFSPNAVMRPLYQETILPNLAYIGGAGELSYWLQLKHFFEEMAIPFPILFPRNSALHINDNFNKKRINLDVFFQDIFLDKNAYINKRVRKISNIEIDFSPQKEVLKNQFEALKNLAQQTDKSFLGAVKAQEKKQLKGLETLEKRLLKAQKKVLKDEVFRAVELKQQLFPNGKLQERETNFSEFYLEKGDLFIQKLMEDIDPFNFGFSIIS